MGEIAKTVLLTTAAPYIYWVSELAVSTWDDIQKYLSSNPTSNPTSNSNELVVYGSPSFLSGPLQAYDYVLIGTTAAGAYLLLATPATLVGGAVLFLSLLNGYQRNTTRVIGAAGLFAAYAISQPAEAIKLAGSAAGAAFAVGKQAVELSTTVVGALVTVSGAIVGYLVLSYGEGKPSHSQSNKRKRKIEE